MDFSALASELLRALRGKRSQAALSRWLGYRSNVAYTWESGRRFPTAAEALHAAERLKIDVAGAFTRFFSGRLPDALARLEPTSPAFVAAFLRELRGTMPMPYLAARSGLSRSSISRILSGTTEPRLPLFLQLVEIASRRMLDLVAGLVDVALLPEAAVEWARVEALRRLAVANPLSEVVPRFLELDQYAELPRHRRGWIAERMGIDVADEDRTLADLATAGVIQWDGKRWRLDERSVDTTRADPSAVAALRAHWTDVARDRIARGAEGLYSYLVFSSDDATLAQLEELRLRYFRELRALVRTAPTTRRVAVAVVHLFPVDR